VNGQLLDTNVVSALRALHRQPAAFQQWLRGMDVHRCYVSSLTWMEIQAGILKKRRTDTPQAELLDAWFRSVYTEFQHRTVAFDDSAATVTAPLWLLRSRGSIDTLIAGTALAHGLDLVTRNATDFTDVPGLTVINPWDERS
jgi:predicted nucleic acid-binding protein